MHQEIEKHTEDFQDQTEDADDRRSDAGSSAHASRKLPTLANLASHTATVDPHAWQRVAGTGDEALDSGKIDERLITDLLAHRDEARSQLSDATAEVQAKVADWQAPISVRIGKSPHPR